MLMLLMSLTGLMASLLASFTHKASLHAPNDIILIACILHLHSRSLTGIPNCS